MATIPAVNTLSRVCITLTLVATAGCSGPRLQPAFESVNPQERTAALLHAARQENGEAIPKLIVMLYSADPAERMLADEALRRLTGQDFGYRHYETPWKRDQAADEWREWWLSQPGHSVVVARFPDGEGDRKEAP